MRKSKCAILGLGAALLLGCGQATPVAPGGSYGGSTGGSGGSGTNEQTTKKVTIYASDDSYISSGLPMTNFGSERAMNTGVVDFGYDEPSYYTAFAKFDFSSIPWSADVLSAKLEIWTANDSSLVKPEGTMTVSAVTGTSWNERSLTYVNAPVSGSYIAAKRMRFQTDNLHSFDVTDSVRKWLSGNMANRGFMFKTRNLERDSYAGLYASELDPDAGPKLIVRYR